jgi:DNA-binding response OmpR family regulator
VDLQRRLEVVEAENERLREEIAILERALMPEADLPVEWNLTGYERQVFLVLLGRQGVCTKDTIMAALYRDLGKDEADIKIVDVLVCKARKKLRPFGVEIKTVWGVGYQLADEARRMFAGAIAA